VVEVGLGATFDSKLEWLKPPERKCSQFMILVSCPVMRKYMQVHCPGGVDRQVGRLDGE